MDELLNPETDERPVLYVCMIPVWYAHGSIGGSAFDIALQRLDGEKKVQEFWSRQNLCKPQEIFSRAACLSPLVCMFGCRCLINKQN